MRFASILVLFAQAVGVNHAAAQPTNTPKSDRNGDPLPDGVVARLGNARFRPSEGLGIAALSPDGTTVARVIYSKADDSSRNRMRIDFMDAATGRSLRQYPLEFISTEELHFTPDHAVSLLKERVRPVPIGDPAVVAKLVRQLGHEEFAEREDTQKVLEQMGEGVTHLLAKALSGEMSPEVQRRVGELLRKSEATSAQGRQHKRAVALLEWIGTPAATDLLRTLAGGAPLTLDNRSRSGVEASASVNGHLPVSLATSQTASRSSAVSATSNRPDGDHASVSP